MSKTTLLENTPTESVGVPTEENSPLSAEHAELFRALDRLLTIGSYYTPEHARYQEVAREAHAAIRTNLMGAASLEIECTTEGFYVHDIFIEGNQRATHRIFELMHTLNIALLEIQAAATSNDLHEAVTTLKKHQVTFAGAQDYEEIEITGMPDTIATTSQNLYVRTRDRTSGPGGTRPRAGSADHYIIPEANLVTTPEGQKLEREFLGIISSIMRSGDPTQLKNLDSDKARNEALRHWVSDSAILTIKKIMGALKETNSDPMILEHLIGHAQSALELTGDPDLVNLVFERLRKETGIKSDKPKPLLSNRPKPKNPKKHAVKYTMTPEQMNGIIEELNESAVIPDDLLGPSTADCLGICTQVLCSAPTEQMAQGIGSTIFRILSAETIPDEDLRISVSALMTVLKTGSRDAVDTAMPMFFSPLRKFHPRHLGPVWLGVWKSLVEIDHKRLAWPHLVNELLMGVEWEDPTQKLALFESLSRVRVGDGEEMLERLEELRALREKMMAPELFHAPAPLLYPVHIVLLGSTMSREHGPKLHERMAHQRANRLANLLVEIMGEYKQSNKLIYQAMLEQGVSEKIIPKLQDLGSRLLKATVTNLSPELRDELWVSEAVSWLGKLDKQRAKPTLTRILKEKKYFFWPVWPSECRQAAREILAVRNEEDDPIDERETSVDEIQ
ncbi:MAG: hypothetical protein KAH56_04390 [Candidatus Krumholzibacteria bacterium]|nr:hypothetical protein [Candidatus Krumholzibacteria bacterium]